MNVSSLVMVGTAIVLGIAGAPQYAAPSDYNREVGPRYIMEVKGYRMAFSPRAPLSIRIERFALSNGCDPDIAPELAELLVACDYPRVLAAIACRESRFDLEARGAVGERGMFQVRPDVWGDPGRSVYSQVQKTNEILSALIERHRNLSRAVERYNGTGADARRYCVEVLQLAQRI